jgi:hypothetical protein
LGTLANEVPSAPNEVPSTKVPDLKREVVRAELGNDGTRPKEARNSWRCYPPAHVKNDFAKGQTMPKPETRRDVFAELYVAGIFGDAGWSVNFPNRDVGLD